MKHDWNRGVQKWVRGGKFVLEIDTDLAVFHERPWKNLGNFGKRKYENYLFITNQDNKFKLPVVFCYKP